ncbi:hypothetical protein PBY51_017412 [Eleginops maclovinus]|uniref:Uncharacterized protein n=1 Tax=Eleginops maclovinus TaxID=56733 RepID=A0AAN7XIY3_ELEMC|nr:hypothetical protein PBY51_017412 [Eleginops maclovinus]
MAKKKFQIFWGGEGLAFFCSAGESCLNGEQEHNRRTRNHSDVDCRTQRSAGWEHTGRRRVVISQTVSLSGSTVSTCRVNGQTSQLFPLAPTPLRVWGVLVVAGGGVHREGRRLYAERRGLEV